MMSNGITIRGWFRENHTNSTRKTIPVWRVSRETITKSISWRRHIRRWLIRRRRHVRGRWLRSLPSTCIEMCDRWFIVINSTHRNVWSGTRRRVYR
jgi:hypothetical protein